MKKSLIVLMGIGVLVIAGAVYYFLYGSGDDQTVGFSPVVETEMSSYTKNMTEGEVCGYVRKLKNIGKEFGCDAEKTTADEGADKGKDIWDLQYEKENPETDKDSFIYVLDYQTGNVLEGPNYVQNQP